MVLIAPANVWGANGIAMGCFRRPIGDEPNPLAIDLGSSRQIVELAPVLNRQFCKRHSMA